MIEAAVDEAPAESTIRSARVEILVPAIRKSMLSSVVSIAVFGGLLAFQSPIGLAVWLVIRLVVSGGVLVALTRLSQAALGADRLVRALASLMAVSGVVWGAIPLLVRPDQPEWRAVVVLWLFGNQSVVTAVCSASKPVFGAACGSVTIIGALSVLLYGDSFSLVLAGLLILGGVYSLSIFGAMHQSVNSAIQGRLGAAALATSLADRQVELQEANTALAHLASRDELTSTYNRRSFFERLVNDDGQLVDNGWLVYIDLDRFKTINDTHGHAAGDHILQISAQRWQGVLPPNGILARTGGDEFSCWFAAASSGDARRIAERLNDCLSTPVALDGTGQVEVSCSIGVTEAKAGEPFVEAAARADRALYRVKARGRDDVEVDDPSDPPVEERASTTRDAATRDAAKRDADVDVD